MVLPPGIRRCGGSPAYSGKFVKLRHISSHERSFFGTGPAFYLVFAAGCNNVVGEFFLVRNCDRWVQFSCSATVASKVLFISAVPISLRPDI